MHIHFVMHITKDFQTLTRQDPVQHDLALRYALLWGDRWSRTFRGPFQSKTFYDCMIPHFDFHVCVTHWNDSIESCNLARKQHYMRWNYFYMFQFVFMVTETSFIFIKKFISRNYLAKLKHRKTRPFCSYHNQKHCKSKQQLELCQPFHLYPSTSIWKTTQLQQFV